MRIGVVTLAEVLDPLPVLSLVEALVLSGSTVTVLRLSPAAPTAGEPRLGDLPGAVELVDLPPEEDATPLLGSRPGQLPYRVDRWLRGQDGRFDLVHFPLGGGAAFYAVLAKQHGLAYRQTTLCVWIDPPTLSRLASRGEAPAHPDFVELDFLERQSLLRADVAIRASTAGVSWCRTEGWNLPAWCVEPHPSGPPELIAAWHEGLLTDARPAPGRRPAGEAPRVSVCLTHFDQPRLLAQALESLRRQDYPDFEVVLVDDGSRTSAATSSLVALEPEFARRGWRIVRQENRFLGAARNAAARSARGEYLLFMDDDNYARPGELSIFMQAMRSSGADILTCLMDLFSGDEAPSPETQAGARVLFLGGALGPGMFRNLFGDANALFKRSVFFALGGFTEDRGLGSEDGEIFARAVLAGYRLEVVPEGLFWYRVRADSMSRTMDRFGSERRRLRPYREAVPPDLRPLVDLTYAMGRQMQARERDRRQP
jgi:GT2 family glycosyltransferase